MSSYSNQSSNQNYRKKLKHQSDNDSDLHQLIYDNNKKSYIYESEQYCKRKQFEQSIEYFRSKQHLREGRSRSRQRGSQSYQKNQSDRHKQNYQKQNQRYDQKHKRNHKNYQIYGSSSLKDRSKSLQIYDHLYFIEYQNAKVTGQIAALNCVITNGLRPKKILIILQTQNNISSFIKQSKINRSISIIDYQTKYQIQKITRNADIVIMTQQKSSIILGLSEDDIGLFELVINFGKSYSVQYYSLLPQFLGEYGTIFTIFNQQKQLQRHEKKLKIKFKQFDGQIQKSQIQKQIFNQIQFKSNDNNKKIQELTLLKSLPYSIEQTAIRLFQMLKQKYAPSSSIYLNRQGYVTYCLKTEIQFNSMKYIWNFIREEMSPNRVKNIKDMKKFQNQRGAIFNVPTYDVIRWQNFRYKIVKNQRKYKGYKLYQLIGQLPKLQDTQTQQYKALQHKKDQALKNRNKLQLFIAGIPYQVNQVQIRKFFQVRGINLFLVRILRDTSGFSKGIAFGLPQSQQHFNRAMSLNGQKFGDRVMRVKLADQRENK